MKHKLSLKSDIFTKATEDFDLLLWETIRKMRKQDSSDGAITLKINIALESQFPFDDEGNKQEIYVPDFKHEITAAITSKDSRKGKLDGDYTIEEKNGQMFLFDRDSGTLFDKEGGDDA